MSNQSLTQQLVQIMKEYTDEIDSGIEKVISDVGKESAQMLKSNAPVKTGKYRRSLTIEISAKNGTTSFTAYAKAPYYRLTHLLENGHKTNFKSGRFGGKRKVAGKPNFELVQDWADKEATRRIEEVLKV